MPPKSQLFRALYAFEVAEPDELEMAPGDVVEVTVVHAGTKIRLCLSLALFLMIAGDWGVGFSRRTQKTGSFPWSYVEPLQLTSKPHTLEPARFTVPTYCQHCSDFIWGGTGAQSFKCRGECLIRFM